MSRRRGLDTKTRIGLALLGLMLGMAIVGPMMSHVGATSVDPSHTLVVPSRQHFLGTDQFGRDVLTRIVFAGRLDLALSFTITSLAFTVGTLVGAVSGYFGGWLDTTIMRAADIVLSFPAFILAMGIAAMLGKSVHNLIIAVALAYTPYFVRLIRAEMLRVRETGYCEAAVCGALPSWRIIVIHLLPNAITPAVVQAVLCAGWSLLDTAGLSFLGLGIAPPTAEWGLMVAEGTRDILSGIWWTSLAPGVAVVLIVLGFNLVSDWVRSVVAGGSTT